MHPVVPYSLDGLVVIVGSPLSGMVCVPVLMTVVSPPEETVVTLFL